MRPETTGSLARSLVLPGLLFLVPACSGGDAPPPSESGTASKREVWKPPAPVDVVLIVVDTLRGDVLGDTANKYDTPNIDRLAEEGVAFLHAFSAAPMTLPSHMSLFSSRSPFETKITNNGQYVPRDLPLIAEWLSDHGYDSRAVLSLGTLDPLHKYDSPARGFEAYDYEYWNMSRADATHARMLECLDDRDEDEPLFFFAHYSDPHEPWNANRAEHHEVEVKLDGKVLTRLVASEMEQWEQEVELTGGRNVFEFESLDKPDVRFRVRHFEVIDGGTPHAPQWETGGIMDRVTESRAIVDRGDATNAKCTVKIWINDVPINDDARRRRYAGEVNLVDEYVGRLIAELERRGIYDDALVIFTSDHGEAMGEHKYFGHVQKLTDDQIHVPLIIKLPRNDPRKDELAAVADNLVPHLDLIPTLLEVVGLPPLPGQRGTSLFEPHEVVHIAETHRPEAKKNQMALRDKQFKLVYFPDAEEGEDRFEMYDLVADPAELVNVFRERASERPEWPEKLHTLYQLSQGDKSTDDSAEAAAMLKALGYGGGD